MSISAPGRLLSGRFANGATCSSRDPDVRVCSPLRTAMTVSEPER